MAASPGRGGRIAVLELVRPLNGAIAGASALVGAAISGRPLAAWPAVGAAVASLAVASGANALNDFFDRGIDRTNRPGRPIPSGRVSPRVALGIAWGALGTGLAVAWAVGPWALGLAVSWVALVVLYCARLKGVAFVGNAVVALVASSAFVMGAASQERAAASLIPLALAFLYHLAREIVKDVEDLEGDAASGAATLAVRLGAERSMAIARAVLVALVILTAAPYALGVYGAGYAVVVAGVDAVLVWVVISGARGGGVSRVGAYSKALKLGMIPGVFAILLGGLGA